MPLLRTQGIVLRTRDLGEHDRLVALYTRDLGKLTAVAPGARRLRSRFGGALELFTWGDVVGFEREGRELVRLDQFDIRRSFRGLRETLEALGQGARMVEALGRLTPERDPHPACFALLLHALRLLETSPAGRTQLVFTLRLLDLLGHRPRLDRCGACACPVGTTAVAFDPSRGSLVCARCRPAPDRRLGLVTTSPETLGTLRGLQGASWASQLRARVPARVEREGAALLDGYVSELGGGPLRTPRFVARTLGAPGPP